MTTVMLQFFKLRPPGEKTWPVYISPVLLIAVSRFYYFILLLELGSRQKLLEEGKRYYNEA